MSPLSFFVKINPFTPDKLVSLRQRFGWTQQDCASVLNVTRACIASWETGRKTPSGTAVRLLALWDKEPDATLRAFRRVGLSVPDRGIKANRRPRSRFFWVRVPGPEMEAQE
jgi:DNA-binding XRE family transcriptional regulator